VVGPDGQVGRSAVWFVSVCRVGRMMDGRSAAPLYIGAYAGASPPGGRARPPRACREDQAGEVGVRRPATRRFENRPRLGFQPPCDRGRTRHGHPSPGVVSNSCRRALQTSCPPEAAHTPPEPSSGLYARPVGPEWPSPWPWNRQEGTGRTSSRRGRPSNEKAIGYQSANRPALKPDARLPCRQRAGFFVDRRSV
jgi:hypothetical protein